MTKQHKKPRKTGKTRKPAAPQVANKVRIQKILAASGFASRRQVEGMVKAGEIQVNGSAIGLGYSVDDGDRIQAGTTKWQVETSAAGLPKVAMYHKRLGEVCTRNDPEGRPSIFKSLPRLKDERWIGVGRLDLNTTGLMLFTTNGELANALMHPSNGVDREYACRIHGQVQNVHLENLRAGVLLEDGTARFSDIAGKVSEAENQWFHVVILEGRNREVRRMWASQGLEVSRLKRVRYGPVFLPKSLRQGKFELLSTRDVRTLCEDVGVSFSTQLTLKKLRRGSKGRPT